MHPAPSIILFTVLSGFGFGGLFFLGLGLGGSGAVAVFFQYAFAGAAAAIGLAFSFFHLGHPERALKAFSQWRSSWLSREGWLASVTLVLAAVHGGLQVFFGQFHTGLGLALAALSVATVFATSMIYAQLRTVPRWHHVSTNVIFLLMAGAGGAMISGQTGPALILIAMLALAQIWGWMAGDGRFAAAGSTLGSATGLGSRGKVRAFEPPHTGTNYLMTEMIHIVARRNVLPLRVIGFVLTVGVPVLIIALFGAIAIPGAIIFHLVGALVLRWLFFAEAEHVVGLYYGKR